MTATPAPATWHYEDNFARAWAETEDPRVIVVIERDTEAYAPHGDGMAPAYFIDYRDEWFAGVAGQTFQDEASERIARRYVEAFERFRYAAGYCRDGLSSGMIAKSEAMLTRWLRIFHNTTAQDFTAGCQNADHILILNTPSYRAHVGMTDVDNAPEAIDGERAEWVAFCDGEVYGIGYAVNPERVLTEARGGEPAAWDDFKAAVNIESWGFYGESHAKESALSFEAGSPVLPALLSFELVNA